MDEKGMLFVVSGLSGAGKGTLCNLMLERLENLYLSVSATTRRPRQGEIHGVNYFFTDIEEFKQNIHRDEYLEWAKVYNNFYGTPVSSVMQNLNTGKDVILEIDIQGAMQIKERIPNGIFIFILPPDLKEQKKRILLRGGDKGDSVKLRLRCAKDEIRAALKYDYIIVNQVLSDAAKKLESIIIAERCRTHRNSKLIIDEENILA